ncbi:MAG: hypothetical protein HRO68_00460 [Nitrosopumilus sp.]|nr:hypothetical protein [Nitrosopumilus sp.]
MSQVEEKSSKQNQKVKMMNTWQLEVSNDRNLVQNPIGLTDSLSNISDNITPKNNYAKLPPEQKIFLNYGIYKHETLEQCKIPFTDVTIIQCTNCHKEIRRYYT